MAGSPKKRLRRMQAIAAELDIPVSEIFKFSPASHVPGLTIKSHIQGLLYETPVLPPLEEVRGSHLPAKDQVWYRDETYLQWDWNTDDPTRPLWHIAPEPGQLEWYVAEIAKLHHGEWVMIGGQPTYFNRYCYFFHQWFKLLEGVYPYYKDTSLEYFRFFEICENDPFCLGEIGIKGRRIGFSSMSASVKLLIGLLEDNTLQGIVSKTGIDAQEMFFMVKNGLENLPEFLLPHLNKVTDSEIHIAKPAKRISKHNTKPEADKGKNNRINWLDTAENAYDGRAVRHLTIDEAAKYERTNVQILFTKISDTLVKGAVVKGHVSVFSTVNKGDKGGDNFKALWTGSDHIGGKKDRFGRTETKLKRIFVAGYRGYWGYIDKYGNSVVDTPTPEQTEYLKTVLDPETGLPACPDPYIGAKEYLEEDRRMKAHDPELYAEQVRKYPFTWNEVFRGSANHCHFNLEDLNNQIERIEALLEGTQLTENGRRGLFRKRESGEVYWEDSPGGYWHILEFLNEGNNKSTYAGSIKCPDNTAWGAAGLDTYANAKATVDKGSDACCIIMKRYNTLDPDNSNYPCAMFIGRPPTKEEFHNQIFYGLEYYGIRMLGERSPTDWVDYATSEVRRLASPETAPRLNGYLVPTKRANNSEVYGCAPQDKEQREQHLTEMVEYALNNMGKIKFLRILKDMVNFNINDRTVYDACMAFGYALMALKQSVGKVHVAPKMMNILSVKRSKRYH